MVIYLDVCDIRGLLLRGLGLSRFRVWGSRV